jgi:presenilin-like A22 family membrane protease
LGIALQADRTHPALWGIYVGLCAVCAFAGVAILFSRRWVIAGLVSVLVAYALATFAELAIGGVAPAAWLVMQLVIAIAGGAILLVLAVRTPPEGSAHQ